MRSIATCLWPPATSSAKKWRPNWIIRQRCWSAFTYKLHARVGRHRVCCCSLKGQYLAARERVVLLLHLISMVLVIEMGDECSKKNIFILITMLPLFFPSRDPVLWRIGFVTSVDLHSRTSCVSLVTRSRPGVNRFWPSVLSSYRSNPGWNTSHPLRSERQGKQLKIVCLPTCLIRERRCCSSFGCFCISCFFTSIYRDRCFVTTGKCFFIFSSYFCSCFLPISMVQVELLG